MKVLLMIDRWLHRWQLLHRAFTNTWIGALYHKLVGRT